MHTLPPRQQHYSLSILLLLCLDVGGVRAVRAAELVVRVGRAAASGMVRGVIRQLFLLHLGVLFHYLYLQWSGGTLLAGCAGAVLMAIGWVVVVVCQDNNGVGWSFHSGGVVILLLG